MSRHLILYAPNVHTGGGYVLLQALLQDWPINGPRLTVFLDARARHKLLVPAACEQHWVVSSVAQRLKAERELAKLGADRDATIFCFHGLPPLHRCAAPVIVFLQNRLYLGSIRLSQFAWKTAIRLGMERCIGRILSSRVNQYVVQTPTMRRELCAWLGDTNASARVLVRPFMGKLRTPESPVKQQAAWDFVYVADGEAHKNHRALIKAWKLLAADGLRPTLALTLSSRNQALCTELALAKANHDLAITDLGHLPHEEILKLYASARALVFPSISESFGLPLIEATHMGLPVIAGEVDFVRDVCTPVQTFDPVSPVSMARAIKRFLSRPEKPLALANPSEFWAQLLDKPE